MELKNRCVLGTSALRGDWERVGADGQESVVSGGNKKWKVSWPETTEQTYT